MADLRNGTLVEHNTLGIGKIVAIEANAVHVFFPESDRRFAAKLRLPTARPMLRTEGVEANAWLEGLSAFTLDPKVGRYALAASWLTHDEAVEKFRAAYPKAFADPGLVGKEGRAARWRAAGERWADLFAPGKGEKLVAAEDHNGLVKKLLDVEQHVAALHPPADAEAVRSALSHHQQVLPFCAALFELLSVPSAGRARFDKLFAAARSLPVDSEQQWLVATLFPFIASPTRHVLFRPKSSCEAALRLGSDVGESGTPRWAPYAAMRALSGRLLERLASEGAKDFVDVEAFLHVTAASKRRPARSRP